MASESIATVVRMMESLPETAQNQVAAHLREYLLEIQDELRWGRTVQENTAWTGGDGVARQGGDRRRKGPTS